MTAAFETGFDTSRLATGFADPVLDAQAAFRRLLAAFSYVGRIQEVAEIAEIPAPLNAATASFCLTLADLETPLWLDGAAGRPAVAAWLRFHCGAPLADAPEGAAFAVVADPAAMPRLDRFAPGTDQYPDRSCTVVIQVEALSQGQGQGQGQTLRLQGPGIDGTLDLVVTGLPPWFAETWALNHAIYPMGVDLVLTCGRKLVALPRGTRIEG
ncbi:phosphonate C-P lyase system protein PhnH [Arenibaculum pallidiluteum]|uniref:phosphonate C-P lyase system protein PhnH n=1 Tax=Arenibaculum pallidiluteum TaxID=2812559 RepID=UPI001A964F82|nr:phosphonate C-P lyase system protein PhnH [Arenibaculum pallidiluteum]